MIQQIRLGLLVVALVIAQVALFPHLRVDGVAPDLGLVAAVAVAYRHGPEAGAIVGFGAGFLFDLFLRTPLGLSALAWALTGYIVGVISGGMLRTDWWAALVLGAAGGLLGGSLFVLIGGLVGQDDLVTSNSVRVVLIAAAYDAVLAPVIFLLVRWALSDPRAARRAGGGGWAT